MIPAGEPTIRRGTPEDFLAVVRLFDGALLDVEDDRVRALLADDGASPPGGDPDPTAERTPTVDGFVLCATIRSRPVGAIAVATDPTVRLVATDPSAPSVAGDAAGSAGFDGDVSLEDAAVPAHVLAIAVTPARRNRGNGRALVAAAAERVAPRPLSATFERRVRPFYRACGFEIDPRDDRLVGVRPPAAGDDAADR